MKNLWPIFAIFIIVVGFFWQFLFKGLLPIPSDTIVGLYHPYRDFYAKDFSRGIPFKNFMITDPVRQQYPWKNLVISSEKKFQIPLWNPYNFSGYPLLANFQSSAFYPFNILFFLLPFPFAWGVFILLQPLLAGLFMYSYLNNLKLDKRASLFGSIVFGFSGFSISWLEWGNVVHTALWLPLILLCVDKILNLSINQTSYLPTKSLKWQIILFTSLLFSFFAGHLQIFFYLFIFAISYFIWNLLKFKNKQYPIFAVIPAVGAFVLISSIQWISTLQLILLSARNLDQDWLNIAGWFIPWQNAIQVIVPDFFGNPATLNYWGVWNYGEFISYIGVGAFIFAILAFFVKDRLKYFFLLSVLACAILAFPTILAKIPYLFSFPLFSTSQPTRLVFLIDFSLSVLAAFGFNYFLDNKNKKIYFVLGFVIFLYSALWIFVLINSANSKDYLISKQNLIFPTILLFVNTFFILIYQLSSKRFLNLKVAYLISIAVIILLILDLFRFGFKYIPFTSSNYLYPQTKSLEFLQDNLGFNRFISTDSTILPPNFSSIYKLQTLDGYDPLYTSRYAEIMAALGRGKADIHAPFGFNRIITPQNYHNSIIDLFGVKYVISSNETLEPKYKKVFEEGATKIFENPSVLQRAFFVQSVHRVNNKQKSIDYLFENQYNLDENAVVENDLKDTKFTKDISATAKISKYEANIVEIQTDNRFEGFLILTDSFYPTWHATIDGKETKIYLTDYNFRGIIVPKGEHSVVFYDRLF